MSTANPRCLILFSSCLNARRDVMVGYLREDPTTSKFELGAKCIEIELGRVTERRQSIVRLARP